MAFEKFTFLDEVGIQQLSESLLGKVNIRIAERLVNELNATSDEKHAPNAKLVYTLLEAQKTASDTAVDGINTKITEVEGKVTANTTAIGTMGTKVDGVVTDLTTLTQKVDAFTHLALDTVTGPITEVVDPDPKVLYLQRDTEEDKTYVLYIYRAAVIVDEVETKPAEWLAIGDTSVDLVGYWKKTDVDEMRTALKIPEMVAMTTQEITDAVAAAFASTEVFTQAPQ